MLDKEIFVKVCGITSQHDADLCVRYDADLIGFIFHEKSPRNMTVEKVRAIETPSLMRTGVFVDQTVDEVKRIMQHARLNLAQLHGDQDIEFCKVLGKTRVMKVFWPERYATRQDLEADMERFAPYSRFYLLEAGSAGGGHGKVQDWSFLAGLRGIKTWFIAGGLGPDTLKQAIMGCNPCGIDLNSGVESAPGIKSEEKLKAVFDMIHNPLVG
ncbi:phosphoribosylanthranilate isomerase [Desulfovibrio mangrovi]|uniref:phosphoribosylanthranilate isomerase n=1 Tax=Desulfovibrio mangrovi TaxID=2976983 RepID=UPI002245FFAB|nr:phosphoribosylanthranilate isomerase [Desulfovibrio mangrovi]UZP66964.1 phosphoribosylanthranilate isomerase [Desulfovibrio mangrovi]